MKKKLCKIPFYRGNQTVTCLKTCFIVFALLIKSVSIFAEASLKNEVNSYHQAEKLSISGTIKDLQGQALPGVTVIIKGTTSGTVTNFDGYYTLSNVSKGDVLVFSFIGMETVEVLVDDSSIISPILKSSSTDLEEVVAVGYSTVKKANLTGAVGTVDSEAFESRPVQNAVNALQGQMPGLTIMNNSGEPGSEATIRVRDVSSINGGSPLILIDGAEGNLNSLNPADIENISVLKDGTAAIYGARASDGVILVTTKSGGKNQDLKVTLDTYYAIKTPALLKQPTSLYQHAVMGLDVLDGSFQPEYTRDELPLIEANSDIVIPAGGEPYGRWGNSYAKFYKNQDWNDLMIGNGSMQNYNVGLSGGGDKYSYLVSMNYQDEDGILNYGIDNNKRYSVRAKLNMDIFRNLKYETNISYEATDREYSSALNDNLYGEESVWRKIFYQRSWAPMYNPDGNFYTFEGFINPAQQVVERGTGFNRYTNFTFNNKLVWSNIVPGLKLTGQAVLRKSDNYSTRERKLLPQYTWENELVREASGPNGATREYDTNLYKNFTLFAEYIKSINKHDFSIVAGTAHESSNYDYFSGARDNYDQQYVMSLQLGNPDEQWANSSGEEWTINSFFGRFNYTFSNKYLIDATIRADGSSRFASDSRWGYFPGVSVAWRVSEESFLQNANFLDNLKLRASYGQMGNQSGIGLYDYIQSIYFNSSYYPFGSGVLGQMADVSNIASLDRTWETIETINLGLDFTVLNNRLYGSFDYFFKDNRDMLINVTYPEVLGSSAPSSNSGHLKIKGWEATLGWRGKIGDDFNYNISANVSDAQNELVSQIGNDVIAHGYNSTALNNPLSSYFGYVFDGIIQNEQELAEYKSKFSTGTGVPSNITIGDAKYKDLDGDGQLTANGDGSEGSGDMVYLGNTNPRYSYGLNLSAQYKNIDFAIFFQGVGERTMYLEEAASMPMYAEFWQSLDYWYGKYWTPERTDAKYPTITNNSDRKHYNYAISTNTGFNMWYVRMKNVQLGYTLPKQLVEKIKIDRIRVYFSGENLFEFHDAPGGYDPEDGGHYDDNAYPLTRFYSFGLNITF